MSQNNSYKGVRAALVCRNNKAATMAKFTKLVEEFKKESAKAGQGGKS